MTVCFTPWPEEFARRYRELGYWTGRPLTDLLDISCRERPDAIAVCCGNRQFSYAELAARATRLARVLHRRGLRAHDTALVQLPNTAEFYIVFFALLKIGVVSVNALFSHQRFELRAYAEQIQPRLLIVSASHPLFVEAGFVEELAQIAPNLNTVLALGESKYAEDLLDCLEREPVQDTVAQFELSSFQPTAADDVAFFQLSGGSTGTPKLIPRTHDDYYYSVRVSADLCGLVPTTRFLCALPAPHNFPLSSPGALGVFHAGGAVVMAQNPEPLHCFTLIERHQVDMAALVPPAVALWLQAAPAYRTQLRSLKLLQVGGANFAESLARRVPLELGCRLQQVFGMAEGLVNYTRLDDDDERIFTTQGRPMSPADEVRVIGMDGEEISEGETGLLLTRGPYTCRGYYHSPEYNAQVFDTEGFYQSGDLVQRLADGYLRVVGRVKDQINRGGEKIAAEEIENLLRWHTSIVDAALVAMPDALMGEKICAFIVTHDPTFRLSTMRQYLRSLGVAEYKLPDRLELVPDLPLTPVGKIDKKQLRDRFQPRPSPQDL